MSCAPALLDYRLGELLARFMARHPKVQVHLASTNRRVDVIGEGLDIAIRMRFPPQDDSDLVMRVLGDSVQCLAVSPGLLQVHGLAAPLAPADLAGLPRLGEDLPHGEHRWKLQGPGGTRVDRFSGIRVQHAHFERCNHNIDETANS